MVYRFTDLVGTISLDYILFFSKDCLEIDIRATTNLGRTWDLFKTYQIVNKEIDWNDVDPKLISSKCQEFCNKTQRLRAFS